MLTSGNVEENLWRMGMGGSKFLKKELSLVDSYLSFKSMLRIRITLIRIRILFLVKARLRIRITFIRIRIQLFT